MGFGTFVLKCIAALCNAGAEEIVKEDVTHGHDVHVNDLLAIDELSIDDPLAIQGFSDDD